MIQDQINLSNNIQPLRLRCYICSETGHLMNNCNKFHFIPDHEKIIKTHDFSHPQERNCSYKRIKPKRRNTPYKLNQPPQSKFCTLKLNPLEDEYDSSSSEDKSAEELHKINKKTLFFTQISSIKNSDPKDVIKTSLEDLISIEKKKEVSNKSKPPVSDSLHMSDLSNSSHSLNNDSLVPQKSSSDLENKGSTEECLIFFPDEILNFERMHNFKTYFPENNFKEIIMNYNEKNLCGIINDYKQNEIFRLSQYTIRPVLTYQSMRNKNNCYKRTKMKNFGSFRRKKEVSISIQTEERNDTLIPLREKREVEGKNMEKIYLNEAKRKKKFSFLDLVQAVIKVQKAKKGRLKWLMAFQRKFKESINKTKMLFKEVLKN